MKIQPEEWWELHMANKMITKKTWSHFRSTGLLLFINTILHAFGWAIVVEYEDYGNKGDNARVIDVYPARVKFRGFEAKDQDESYVKISKYIKDHADVLLKEARGEKE